MAAAPEEELPDDPDDEPDELEGELNEPEDEELEEGGPPLDEFNALPFDVWPTAPVVAGVPESVGEVCVGFGGEA